MKKPDLSLIIPCYNEGPTFEKSVAEIFNVLKRLKYHSEIIFVEDKSTDNTRQSVEKFVSGLPNVKAIFHLKNEGRGKSVSDGIKMSSGKTCGFMDVDCEVSPFYVHIFVEEIKKGNDMAIATRFYETNNGLLRYFSSKSYSYLVKKILDLPFADTEAGFKFFDKRKILPIIDKVRDKGWFWDTEICARAHFDGLKISEVPVLFIRRKDKKSTVKIIPDSVSYFKKALKFRSVIKKIKRK